MGISIWKSTLFFIGVVIFAVMLFPTQRELGSLYSRSNVMGKAAVYLERQFHRAPEDTANTLRYLDALLYRNDFEKFLALAKKMAAQYPDNISMHQVLANFYKDNMLFKEASQEWLEVIRLNPKDEDTQYNLISYYKLWKDTQGLIRFYHWLIGRDSAKLDDYYDLAENLSAQKDVKGVQSVYAKILKKYGQLEKARLRLAESYEYAGDFNQAIGIYQKLCKDFPQNKDYAFILAQNLLQHGRKKEAAQFFQDAFLRFSKDRDFMAGFLGLYQGLGGLKDTLKIIEALHKNNPDNFQLLKVLGEMYFSAENYKQALWALRSYNEKTGGDYRTRHLLGDVFSALGDKPASEREYREALRLIREENQ